MYRVTFYFQDGPWVFDMTPPTGVTIEQCIDEFLAAAGPYRVEYEEVTT